MIKPKPMIPKGPRNAYRGIGEIVHRNAKLLLPFIDGLEPMDRLLVIQYIMEIETIEGEDDHE